MSRKLKIIISLLLCAICVAHGEEKTLEAPLQQVTYGTIERVSLFSTELDRGMVVDVWLPDGYGSQTDRKYPVIYMHDGQNLFDAGTTWNHQSWEMDSVIGGLVTAQAVTPPIIVGIHSRPESRKGDLMPQKVLRDLSKECIDTLLNGVPCRGDAYASFLVHTLKPYIDSRYRTLRDVLSTTVMGSSMGGLMSIYAFCEYPEIFGNAVCMSTHWVGNPKLAHIFAPAMQSYLGQNLPDSRVHKIYLDHGTETLDSYYGPWEEEMIRTLNRHGYASRDNLKTHIAPGDAHEERAWASRVHLPLIFVLPTP